MVSVICVCERATLRADSVDIAGMINELRATNLPVSFPAKYKLLVLLAEYDGATTLEISIVEPKSHFDAVVGKIVANKACHVLNLDGVSLETAGAHYVQVRAGGSIIAISQLNVQSAAGKVGIATYA